MESTASSTGIDPSTQDPFFSGRVSRRAYWFFFFTWIFYGAIVALIGKINNVDLLPFVGIGLAVVNISMIARRLHDVGRSGWYQMVTLIPVLGAVLLLWELVTPGDKGDNRFGSPQPHNVSSIYVLFTHLMFLVILGLAFLALADDAHYIGKYTAAMVGILIGFFVLTMIYHYAFRLSELKTFVRAKGYLALGFVGVMLFGIIQALNSGQQYDILDNVVEFNLYFIVMSLGVFFLARAERDIVTGECLKKSSLIGLALAIPVLFFLEHVNDGGLSYLVKTPREKLTTLEKINLQKYLWLLSVAKNDDGYTILCDDSLNAKNMPMAEFLFAHGCQADDDRLDRYLGRYVISKEWEWAELLLRHGDNINKKYYQDETILNALISAKKLDDEYAAWLAKHGAKADDLTIQYLLTYEDEAMTEAVRTHFPAFIKASRTLSGNSKSSKTDVSESQSNLSVSKQTNQTVLDNNTKQLNLAIQDGNTRKALRLIESGVDFNGGVVDGINYRPLVFATIHDQIAIVKALLNAGDDVNKRSALSKDTPLIVAIREQNFELAELLASRGADPFVNGEKGHSALDYATSEYSSFRFVMMLLKYLDDTQRLRVLKHAIDKNDLRLSNAMIPEYIKVDIRDDKGMTALMYAVDADDVEVAERLLSAGACVDCSYGNGVSVKERVNALNNEKMVALFVNRSDSQASLALVEAASAGDLEKVKMLVEQGFALDTVNQYGSSALIMAAGNNYPKVVSYLIEQGAEIDKESSFGMTPLMVAAGDGAFESVKELLAHGAKINQMARATNWFALYLAVNEEHLEIAHYLIDQGADLQLVESTGGRSALIRALEKDEIELAKLMIEKGADVHVIDHYGRTALSIAKSKGYGEITTMLVAHGAK